MLNIKFKQVRRREFDYVDNALSADNIGTRGEHLTFCEERIKHDTGVHSVFMTNSATAALDVIANAFPRSCKNGEIIFPSWTFASTVSPFVRAGFKPVFVDVDYKTLNITTDSIEPALSFETVAVVVTHYGGVAADMMPIKKLTDERGLFLIEDAAPAYLTPGVGMMGDFAVFSFNDTKNIGCGEGGALVMRDYGKTLGAPGLRQIVGDLLHKGTDVTRARKEKRQYQWTELGLAPQMTELTAAVLWPELIKAVSITKIHQVIWHNYRRGLASLTRAVVQQPFEGNGHSYWLSFPTPIVRNHFMEFMAIAGIETSRHYQALHTSPAGKRYGVCRGLMAHTSAAESCIVRLPLHPGMQDDVMEIAKQVILCANSALARASQTS